MTVSDLVSAVKQYDMTLTALEAAATTHPLPQQVIDVLMARDEVYVVRTAKTQSDKDSLMMVISLDERLKKQSELITKLVILADWRAIMHPPLEAWWWFLEPPTNKWDKFDWLWSAGSVTLLTASLSLVVDISSRFLTGVPDTLGAFTITTQSVLTLLAAGGALTKTGQETIERFLISLNIPKHFQNEVKFGFAFLLFLCLFSFRFSLPKIAIFYYNQGEQNYKAMSEGTSLCKGDLLSTKSKAGKIVIVKISCTDPSLPNWILSGNSLAGVNNRCTPGSNPNIPI